MVVCAEVPNWPDYRLGEEAERDVFSPVRIQLLNPEATERRRQAEARQVPLFLRHDLDADLQSQAMLRAVLRDMRAAFLDELEAGYARRTLTRAEARNAEFRRLLVSFREQHKGLPLPRDLAEAWATGASDEAWLVTWAAYLKQGMSRPVRPDAWPKGWPGAPRGFLLLALAPGQPDPPLRKAQEMAVMHPPSNVVTLARARREFRDSFPREQRTMARFLSGFLTNNCELAPRLSRQARNRHRSSVAVMDHYQVGDLIVRRGQTIDEQVWRALRELRLQLGRGDWRPMPPAPSSDPASLEPPSAPAATPPFSQDQMWQAMGLGLSVLGLAALGVGWHRRRRRPLPALPAPAPMSPALSACPACHSALVISRDGCLSLHDPLPQSVRASVAAQLAGWLKSRFVRALLGQRAALQRDHTRAEQEIQALSQRLTKTQAPLQQRLQAYETRIADLEAELARKGEVNRELIQAQIEAARKRLEMEKGHDTMVWN